MTQWLSSEAHPTAVAHVFFTAQNQCWVWIHPLCKSRNEFTCAWEGTQCPLFWRCCFVGVLSAAARCKDAPSGRQHGFLLLLCLMVRKALLTSRRGDSGGVWKWWKIFVNCNAVGTVWQPWPWQKEAYGMSVAWGNSFLLKLYFMELVYCKQETETSLNWSE